tara:strand:+ start:25698 stop:26429 length:732 start_codon:yes stop_codon:yes gene_type:complete
MNDLVIALYKEKDCLRKLKNYATNYNYKPIVYNKGGLKINDPIFANVKLPNIGLHTHSYLHHIVKNYENLSEVTIFILGSAFRDIKKSRKAEWLLKNANNCKGFMAQHIWLTDKQEYEFELPYYDIFIYSKKLLKANSKRIKTQMVRADTVPLGKWIENKTNQKLTNKKFFRSSKCIFAVNKELILNKPLSYWENLYSIIDKENEDVRNLEVIHYFERAWLILFANNCPLSKLEHDISTYGDL